MAGVYGNNQKPNPKNNKYSHNLVSSTEVLKDSQSKSPDNKPAFSLRGVLGLGQSVELHRESKNLSNWNQEFLIGLNHLQKEEQKLSQGNQQELEREINELRGEIAKLMSAAGNLEKSVAIAAEAPVVEANIYQVNFLRRLVKFIKEIRQNINESALWLDAFQAKKKKKNYFWGMVKNKKQKGAGEAFLFSDESAMARSAG